MKAVSRIPNAFSVAFGASAASINVVTMMLLPLIQVRRSLSVGGADAFVARISTMMPPASTIFFVSGAAKSRAAFSQPGQKNSDA